MAETGNKTYVVDASFILSFLLNEGNPRVENLMRSYKDHRTALISSPLLSYEVVNGLRTAALRKRISTKIALELFNAYLDLNIREEKVKYAQVLQTALSRNQTFYDVSYLVLAKSLGLNLLTLD